MGKDLKETELRKEKMEGIWLVLPLMEKLIPYMNLT